MRILVTGCAGFIASHLTERLLLAGHEVFGIDNFDPFYAREVKENNLKALKAFGAFGFTEGDIRSIDEYAINKPVDLVFHLAAKAGVLPSLKDPQAYIDVNISGTRAVLEWMLRINCRKLIFASSSSVYGNSESTPFAEDALCTQPISPYAFTKRSCELMNYNYHHLYGMDVLNLRFFTVYGPRQRPDLAIHKFMKKLLNDEPIDMYGDGSTARDYTFVSDTVQGLINAMDYIMTHDKVYEVFNLGNEHPVSLAEMISVIEKVCSKKFRINHMPKQAGDVDITCASIEKAKEIMGYRPNVSFEKGIELFYKSMIEHG